MPYFCIETNQPIDAASQPQTLKKASGFLAELLGKPEAYVMVQIRPASPLIFAGSDDPAAFVQLKSIGLPQDRCAEFSEKICHFIEQAFGVPKDRVFIDFKELQGNMFGWNGKTF